jgi:hypothetical protein
MIFRKNGATQDAVAVTSQPWKEFVSDFDADLEAAALDESVEAVVDLWLEDPQSFMDTEINPEHTTHVGSMMRRVATGGMGLQRADTMQHKTASATNWDDEFANAKAHAASVLSQLGKH